MAIQTIPTDSAPFWTQITELEGTDYRLSFNYNQREDCYYLSIGLDGQADDIISGIKLVTNYRLIRRYNSIGPLPPGEMMAISNNPQDRSIPRLGELGPGGRVELVYFTSDDPSLANG